MASIDAIAIDNDVILRRGYLLGRRPESYA
jgi:hypothetical protein